jgi:hypothetical protein
MYRFKKDKFQKKRGGNSRVLDVRCEGCGTHLAYYQKDGSGLLKRMYVDRFIDGYPEGEELTCSFCKRILGSLIDYKKESRPAYRLFVGAVSKKIVSAQGISK